MLFVADKNYFDERQLIAVTAIAYVGQVYKTIYWKYLNNNLVNNYIHINIIIIILTFNIKMLSHFLIKAQSIPSIKIKEIC